MRVDHPDGLADPARVLRAARATPASSTSWAEKIVEPGEELRDWPIEGTTGYEFLNDVMALFVDAAARAARFTELYEELTGDTRRFEDIAALSKLEVAVNTFEPELRRLHQEVEVDEPAARARVVPRLPHLHPAGRRRRRRGGPRRRSAARTSRRSCAASSSCRSRGHDEFVVRFQQTTGPVMAKGVEDTAFYRYFRLAALNEVGGNPGRFGMGVDEFHAANAKRGERFPLHLLTTYTHDTKRSPDVRARIVALTWLADEWA